jgi:hypothetical protein
VVGEGRWRRIADLLQEAAAGSEVAPAVAEVVAQLLHVEHVSLVLVVGGLPVTTAGSSDLAVMLCERQLALGEGPAVEALRTGEPAQFDDLTAPESLERAPVFISEARAAGVGAMFAFPLRIGGAHVGVLTGHRAGAGPLSHEQHSDALIVSTLASIALLHAEPDGTLAPGGERIDHATVLDGVVQVATGMVAEQLGVPMIEALVRMRAHAFAADGRLEEVARRIIDRELRLER